MKLYLSTCAGSRRRYGWKVRFEWDPTRPLTHLDAKTLRRHYRTLRRAGIDDMAARWLIWDLVDTGRRAIRDNDGTRVSS
jgi:hypothetical protein